MDMKTTGHQSTKDPVTRERADVRRVSILGSTGVDRLQHDRSDFA